MGKIAAEAKAEKGLKADSAESNVQFCILVSAESEKTMGNSLKAICPCGFEGRAAIGSSRLEPQALQREILEELGIGIEVGPSIGTFTTPLDKHLIQLECYWCTSKDREVTLSSHEEAGWFEPIELEALDWARPDLPVFEVVLRTFADKRGVRIV